MSGEAAGLRLLPWSGPEGQQCYVASDGDGYVSRLADRMEAVQLDAGVEALERAGELLGEPEVSTVELRGMVHRLVEALWDVMRVADSRGGRLAAAAEAGTGGSGGEAARCPGEA